MSCFDLCFLIFKHLVIFSVVLVIDFSSNISVQRMNSMSLLFIICLHMIMALHIVYFAKCFMDNNIFHIQLGFMNFEDMLLMYVTSGMYIFQMFYHYDRYFFICNTDWFLYSTSPFINITPSNFFDYNMRPFIFNLHFSLYLKCCSYKKHIIGV